MVAFSLRHRLVAIGLASLASVSLAATSSGEPPSPSHKRVLAIYFAKPDDGAFAGVEPALRNELADTFGDSLEYRSEYLDLIRFDEPGFQSAMRAYLKMRYEGARFDAIIAASPLVLQFLKTDPALFPDVPVVFMTRPGVQRPANSTGIVSAVDFKGSLSAALRLQPGTTGVFVVSGASAFDRLYEAIFRNDAATLTGPPALTYLSGLPMRQLIDRVRQLPPHSIIYYISVSADGTGDRFLPVDALERLSAAANVPIYSWHEAMLGHGIVGGKLHSSIKDSEEMARLAARVINGEKASAIRVANIDSHVYEFDAGQLARWRISEGLLPAGSVVRFGQASFWEKYRSYVVGGLLIFAAQFVLIIGLVLQGRSLRRAEAQSRTSEELYRTAAERNIAILRAVPDLMFVIRRDGTYLDYSVRDDKLLFAPPAAFLGRTVREIMPPALVPMFMDAIERAFRRDEAVVVEYELPLDEPRHFEARIVYAGGDRVLTMVRDVTDEKRTAQLNRDLAGRLIASQEAERRRIARELHDDVSQKMALLMMDIDRLANRVPQEPLRFRDLSERAREVASDLHDLSYELHPSKLEALGLLSALQSLCRDLSKQSGIPVVFTHGDVPGGLGPDVSLCLYRITQEALHNVARHSHADRASVHLMTDADHVMLQIEDSGVGFDLQHEHAGLGLVSIRERAALLRGQVAVHSAPGSGTRIGVRVPLVANEQAPGDVSSETARPAIS